MDAFNEIVNWKGGMISEVSGAGSSPKTIDLDWQILLMEAVRKMDETRGHQEARHFVRRTRPEDSGHRRQFDVAQFRE